MSQLNSITESAIPLLIEPGSIDLWQIDFFDVLHLQSIAERFLTADELSRAARLRVFEPRQRFLFYRLALRYCLARYLGIAPNEVVFDYEGFGKPVLAHATHWQLQFNLTHKLERAYLAIGEHPLGIDWEPVHERFGNGSLARQILHTREMEEYVHLPVQAQADFLLQHWTGKEAVLKACGSGLIVCPTKIALCRQAEIDWSIHVDDSVSLPLGQWKLQTRHSPTVGSLSLSFGYAYTGKIREQCLTKELQEWLNATIL